MMDEIYQKMLGDYKLLHDIHIGDRVVIIAENPALTDEQYLVSYVEYNDLVVLPQETVVGGDYLEAMQEFCRRVQEQIAKERKLEPAEKQVITAEMCVPTDWGQDINGKVVAFRPEVLRREYRSAQHQLYLVTGGFGASGDSRGRAVFGTNLATGKTTRFDRQEILGEVKSEHLPAWAKESLTQGVKTAEKTKGEPTYE